MTKRIHLILSLLILTLTSACNGRDDDTMRERLPVIELAPTDLCKGLANNCSHEFSVTDAALGGFVVKEVSVFNPGEGPLEIRAVRLEGDAAGAFSLELPDGLAAALADGEGFFVAPLGDEGTDLPREVSVRVRFTPVADAPSPTAVLVIENDSTNQPAVLVNLGVLESPPSISVSPEILDFGQVTIGAGEERSVNVLNVGGEDLLVHDIKLSGSLDFTVVAGGQEIVAGGDALFGTITLPPNTGSKLTIRFEASSATPADATLVLYSNDPAQSGGTTILLLGNQTAPCVAVHPKEIDFGPNMVGTQTIRPLEISSCGQAPLTLTGIRLADGSASGYSLDLSGLSHEPSPAVPLVIPIGGEVVVNIVYLAETENPLGGDGQILVDQGAVTIETDALTGDVEVPLSGWGSPDICPVAIIQVAEGSEVDAQTVLHLYGDQSYAPAGAITKWEWTVEQPAGSQFTFIPSATFPNPTFEANVVGLYRFHLTVWDEYGIPSCQQAMAEVAVTSECNIHVELLWHTPEDPDETDEGPEAGSDVDLHLIHPWAGGPDIDGDGQPDGWFDQPFDCFWFNAHPEWGSFDPAVNDDPDLDRDDTDGAGPENINLCGTPEDALYRVGVHYWNDHGYGASYATVRVYIYSQLVFEVSDVKMMSCDMWEVCTVEWPSGKVKLVTNAGGEYKITPNYESPFFENHCN